jgi:hypothetical protein
MNSTKPSNSSNSTGQTNGYAFADQNLINILTFMYSIGYIYIVPFISVTAFGLNLVSLIVFLNPKLKGKLYNYFVSKSISELIFLLLGALYPVYFCTSCPTYATMGWAILIDYGVGIGIATVYTYSGLCEIAIIYDRLVAFYQIRRFDFDSRIIISTMLLISVVPFIPELFASYISQSASGKYTIQSTGFGLSPVYLWYIGLVGMTESLIIFAVLITMNILLVQKFKIYLARKRRIVVTSLSAVRTLNSVRTNAQNTASNAREEDPERRITLMVIVHSFVLILSRTCQSIDNIIAITDIVV